jgi:phage recombination protein Bet
MGTALTVNRTGALTRSDTRRLKLFCQTKGKELVGDEIDQALEWCEIYQANPFTNDIYFFVFGKHGTDGRRVVPVISIGHYRKIAARSGNYRPDDKPARFTYDDSLIGPANPKGIVSCEVSVYRHSHGEWFPVTSSLRWEERAPLIDDPNEFEWVDTGETWEDSGKPKKTKRPKAGKTGGVILDPSKKNWRTMPETMLAKCVEADAIRKGWPNETAGSYCPEEMDQSKIIDLTATEIIEKTQKIERVEAIGGHALYVQWEENEPLSRVAVGKFYDQVMAFIIQREQPGKEDYSGILAFKERNRVTLQEFWALQKDAALELRKVFDQVAAQAAKSIPTAAE